MLDWLCLFRKADPDPDGAKLAATSDPLGEATKLLEKLKQHADSRCALTLASVWSGPKAL